MRLKLLRTYHPNGTNGRLFHQQQLVCYTIELPWFQNQRNISCIPEGEYELIKRTTEKRGNHLMIKNVSDRTHIIFHPANYALKELEGCIAPVSKLETPGIGFKSREATQKLEKLCFEALGREEQIFITIKEETEMNIINRVQAPTPKFFRVLRTIGLTLAAAGGAIMASPIALPVGIITLGGYLVTGGAVLSAVSQATVDENTNEATK